MNELATALILRAVADDRGKVDQIRRYLRHAFSKSAHRDTWQATGRTTDQLVEQALTEVRQAIGNGSTEEPGPASMELAVRASYPLVVSGRLNADRGSSGNDQPDRRTPGEILDAMRRSLHGVRQLGQALHDFEQSQPLRAVDEDGKVKRTSDGSSDQTVSDIYLRHEFPPPGKAKAARPGDTPTDRYENAVAALSRAFDELDRCFGALSKVVGDDGQPVVDARGVDLRLTDAWRETMRRVDTETVIWARSFSKMFGAKPDVSETRFEDEENTEDLDPYANIEDDEAESANSGEQSEEAVGR
jgi:hypothetical protein